jgi:hypothetical protein
MLQMPAILSKDSFRKMFSPSFLTAVITKLVVGKSESCWLQSYVLCRAVGRPFNTRWVANRPLNPVPGGTTGPPCSLGM